MTELAMAQQRAIIGGCGLLSVRLNT